MPHSHEPAELLTGQIVRPGRLAVRGERVAK